MPFVSVIETVDEYKVSVTPSCQNDIRSFLLMMAKEQVFVNADFQLKCMSQGNVTITFTFGRNSNTTEYCVNFATKSNPQQKVSKSIDRPSYNERHVTFNGILLEHMKKHGWKWINYNRSDQKDNPIAEWTFEKPTCTSKEWTTAPANFLTNHQTFHQGH